MNLKHLATLACALAFPALAAAQVKWDLPTGYATSNYHWENIDQFAKDVDKATNGKLKITVHPNGSLFKLTEIKRAVETGQVALGEVILSAYSNEDPIFGVDSVPFLVTSFDEANKLMRVSRAAVDERFAKRGMQVLFSVPWPPQGLYANKPINSGADLAGSKWRAYNPYTARMAEILGAQPVTIQAAELPQALATGAVQSFVSSPSMGYDSKVWETQIKYFYDVKAWLPRNVVFVNKKMLDALDKPTRDAVLAAAAAAEKRGWTMADEKYKWYRDQLVANGLKVEAPNEKLRADLKKIGDTMTAEWVKTAGPDGALIVENLRK
jgi:TRAP-type C4-dicarboxylate transport system substrate-binding protein